MENDFFWVNCSSSRKPSARTKISREDAQTALLYKWSFTNGPSGQDYVRAIDRSTKPPRQVKLHRLIMNAPEGMHVDHINGDPLDNRRENLRIATPQQNQANSRKRAAATSHYKGVSWHKKSKQWRATINFNRKQEHLGFFKDQDLAAAAYDARARQLFGEFACPNLPERTA